MGIADAGERLPAVSKRDPLRVVRALVEAHTLHASEPGARGAVSSFQQVVKMAYPEPERDAGFAGSAPGVTIHLDESTARAILDDMRRARELSAESE